MNLRRRIVLTTTVLLTTTSLLFAIISLVSFDRTLRSDTSATLFTLARAVGQVIDSRHGHVSVDAGDRAQIATLHGPNQHVAVLDAQGRLVFGEPVPQGNERRGLLFGQTTVLHQNGSGKVVTWQSDAWILAIDRTLIAIFAMAGFVLVAVGALISRVLAQRILDPVERIASVAEQIEARDLSRRLNASANDELGRLCASFDRMLERLDESFQTERRFVADASHELRTPLAVVRAETDLALRRSRSEEEYVNALQSIGRETARLEEIVDQLLDTMRDRAIGGFERIDVGALLEQTSERVHAAFNKLTISAAGDTATVGNHEALQRAILAVLHNAITHGGGSVEARVCDSGTWVELSIADRGPGFTAEALAHATERFWRGDSARSRGGTGLGLSIARILVEAHGGSIRLENQTRGGAVVTLLLPRAQNQSLAKT